MVDNLLTWHCANIFRTSVEICQPPFLLLIILMSKYGNCWVDTGQLYKHVKCLIPYSMNILPEKNFVGEIYAVF